MRRERVSDKIKYEYIAVKYCLEKCDAIIENDIRQWCSQSPSVNKSTDAAFLLRH